MQESKSCALPLGDSPIKLYKTSLLQAKDLMGLLITIQGGYRDSNPRPPEPQSGALTSCAISTTLAPQPWNVPEGIRTPDPRLRRPLLYPTELRTHIQHTQAHKGYFNLYFPVCQHFFQQRLNFFYHITFPKHLQQENAKNQPF